MGSMSTPAGWEPYRSPKQRAGADAFHLSPFARLARTHVLVAAGDALVAIALANSLFFDLDPNDARWKVFLYLALTMAPLAVVAPFIGPALDRSDRRPPVDDRRRHGRPGARVLRDDRRPPGPAAVPGGVRGAGHGQGLRRVAQRHRAHRRARRRRAGGGQLEAPAAVGPRRAAGRASRPASPTPSPAPRACWWSRWSSTWPPPLAALRIPTTQVAAAPATAAESAELHGAGIRLAASAMGLVRGIVGFLTFLLLFDLRDEPTWQIGAVLVLSGAGALLGSALAPSLRRGAARGADAHARAVGGRGRRPHRRVGRRPGRAACCSPPSWRSCRRRAGWPSTRSCSATPPTPTAAGPSPPSSCASRSCGWSAR